MTLHGHDDVRRRLLDLPPGQPVLLSGPSGIGKHMIAAAAAYHHAAPVDVLTFRPARMDDVRELTTWLRTGAIGGPHKAVALDLDGSVPSVAQALLKTLEEPPSTAYIIVSSSGQVPATVASRVLTLPCRPLSSADTAAVLSQLGIFGDDVRRLVALAGGRPGRALEFREAIANRAKVLQLIGAITRKDWNLVAKVLASKWDASHVQALRLWLADVLDGTTHAYAPGEKGGLQTLVPRGRLEAATVALNHKGPPSLVIALAARNILG